MSDFSRMLKRERENTGLKQSEVSESSGVPRTKISAYENNKQLPSRSNLTKLLKLYETSEELAKIINDAWKYECSKHPTRTATFER